MDDAFFMSGSETGGDLGCYVKDLGEGQGAGVLKAPKEDVIGDGCLADGLSGL